MAKALTVIRIEALKNKPGKRWTEVPDGLLPGLYLICYPSGKKTWAVRYRNAIRKTVKFTLGQHPILDLATARKMARGVLTAVAQGQDPAAEKRKVRKG